MEKTFKIDISGIKIEPITNQEQFERASEIIDLLVDADQIEDPAERQQALDLLEAISILAMEFEKRHFPMPKPTPVEAIKERMAQLNLTQKDVAAWFGGENRVSEVLSGKRSLSINMIRALNKNLRIPAEVLLG